MQENSKSVTMGLFERVKKKIKFRVREGTDLESEILNIIAGPIYLYTILSTWVLLMFEVIPYFYISNRFLHKSFITAVLFEMMGNWLSMMYVSNKFSPGLAQERCVNDTNNSKNSNNGMLLQTEVASVANKQRLYWYWRPCLSCNISRPPRCYHCPMCYTCILKRDHHCFFARTCIGLNNQRHFIVFLVWASLGTTYASLHFIYYFLTVYWSHVSILDVFAPFTLIRWIFGYSSLYLTHTMLTATFLIFFVFLSTTFLINQVELITKGITTFESKVIDRGKIKVTDRRNLNDKIKAVFGSYWALNLLVPLHLKFRPVEDPLNWPSIKIS
ncbi:hypothetical protein CHS0354_026869 [Potamilus streckersoni]|uniref:Palmitoyltransferase n=1 Tax=Potamilus streckersoni TaxID=2493646 RepID=A0AAE0SPZ4_9BIVA|nr:hypothetical protein CHS0354_026869 [Potamilus streckersoni]